MIRKIAVILLLIAAGCQPTPPSYTAPTGIPFPTMTIGQRITGELGTPDYQASNPLSSNPATVAAMVVRPTATPNTSACPSFNPDAELDALPTNRSSAIERIMRFLNSGGTVEALQLAMQSEWDAFGDAGYIRDDVDLTGEGRGEVVIGYTAPGDVGTLLILGCQSGRYVQLYEATADGLEPPQIITMSEINNNPPSEIVFARRQCIDAEVCEYQTQIVGWSANDGGFVNLLEQTLLTLEIPAMRDMDNDSVQELVITLDSNGTSATGPLRTGVNIYDWNGEFYVLSIIQLNSPRYKIQVVHEGDKAFSRLDMLSAIELYDLAVTDGELRYWFNDGPITVISYAQYRTILASAYVGDGTIILNTLTQMNDLFPQEDGEDRPVYVEMANVFVTTLQETNDLNESCSAVQDIIADRDEALGYLNRYGVRSPTYSALDLCPY